jgi:hypothetical protein
VELAAMFEFSLVEAKKDVRYHDGAKLAGSVRKTHLESGAKDF